MFISRKCSLYNDYIISTLNLTKQKKLNVLFVYKTKNRIDNRLEYKNFNFICI